MGSLPLPPSIQAPQMPNAPAPFQGYNQPAFGQTSPYPASQGANLIQGINAFLEQFQKSRERDRSQSANMAQQGLQNLMLGLPVDVKKLAGHMKKAGMELDFESTLTPGAAPSVQSHGGESTGVPGSNVPQRTAMPGTPPMVQPANTHGNPQTQVQGPSFWEKVKAAYMGGGGQINPQSPGIAALQRMGQRGQMQQQLGDKQMLVQSGQLDLAQSSLGIDAKKQAVMSAALGGSQQAVDVATRSGMMKELEGDQLFRLGDAAGLTREQTAARILGMQAQGQNLDMMKMMLGVAEKWAPHFGNDLSKATKYVQDIFTKGKSDLVPDSMTMEERIKITQSAIDMQKQHPTAPFNLTEAYAMANAKGDPTAKLISKTLSEKFPTAGDIDWSKWKGDQALQLQQFGQLVTNQNREYDLNVLNAVRGQLGKEFDDAMAVLSNKNSSPQEQTTARTLMSEKLNQLNQLKINIPGTKQTVSFGMGTKLAPPEGVIPSLTRFLSGGYFGNNQSVVPTGGAAEAMKGIMKAPPGVEQRIWDEGIKQEMKRIGALMESQVSSGDYNQPD